MTYVAKVPDGEPVVLRGSAALIWDAATLGAHPLDSWAVAQVVADQVGVQAEDIHEDIQVFLAQLVEGGFLEVVP
ncbi:MAG: PqqD family peptide modification chaperone [Actinomyces urogenitalis]|uniref:PqqD family peptide modification chaperone n=1 Tax=Actinomyces urogenitalis TaxID=103621 RepID=UPI002A80B187|nr:PqqD family peptide modification chaperone [Actinomyces urogenitalis]MDY3677847.1 PqqD family peptide modification chaperone [Actinomyces urogenitalis]